MEKLLSIIIPHYNSPKLLKRLLDSIPSYDEIEVIVVDDRSDKYLDELNEVKKSAKTNILFLENKTDKKGAGTALNIGLEHATGKWLLFAGADDVFTEDFYETISKYFDKDYDVIFFKPSSINIETGKESKRAKSYQELIDKYTNSPTRINEYLLRIGFRTPTSKLIRKGFIDENNIRFSETLICNDDFFSVKVGLLMNKFAVSNEIIYIISEHSKSLTNRKEPNLFWECFHENLRVLNYIYSIIPCDVCKRLSIDLLPWIKLYLLKYRTNPLGVFKVIYKGLKNGLPLISFNRFRFI